MAQKLPIRFQEHLQVLWDGVPASACYMGGALAQFPSPTTVFVVKEHSKGTILE